MEFCYTSGTVNDRSELVVVLGLPDIHRFTPPWAIWRFGPCLQWKTDVGIYVCKYIYIKDQKDILSTGVDI